MKQNSGIQTKRISRGYSLLEVLIAMVIFAFGIMAFSQLQGQLNRVNLDARIRTMASNLAEEQIESQKKFTTLVADVSGGAPAYEDISDGETIITRNAIEFTIQQDVTDYYWDEDSDQFSQTAPAGAVFSDYKQLDVVVTWSGVDFARGDWTGATSGRLGTGSVELSTNISSRVTATNHLALLDELSVGELCIPIVTCPSASN